jgi:hypothetical protein
MRKPKASSSAPISKEIVALRFLPKVLDEWRTPQHDHGAASLWKLLQAFTTVMGPLARRNPHDYAVRTMRLQHLLLPAEPAAPAY